MEELKKEWGKEETICEIQRIITNWTGEGFWTGYGEYITKLISSLLAKQQADFVKCLPEQKDYTRDLILSSEYASGYNACIADIKSKLLSSSESEIK
jgi:hypothetical protein